MTGLAAGLLAYGGLFSSALIASTLFPAQSELVLAGLLVAGKQPAVLLILVATVGNVLGSAINCGLGVTSSTSGTGAGFRSPLPRLNGQPAGITATGAGRCSSPGCRSSATR